jgi:DNA-directed RNA polymerase I subunit RPA2
MVAAFDPLSPTFASSSSVPPSNPSTFHTLTRERAFRHPPTAASDFPALDELVSPHIESFNALIEDESVLGGKGLLQVGVEEVGEKVVFDGVATEGRPFGTKISCEFGVLG